METNHFVYILQCKDNTLYTGYTINMEHRLQMHESGEGAKYTRGRGPFQLVYLEKCMTKSEALRREIQIKRLRRDKKLALISAYKRGIKNAGTEKFSR